MKKIIISLVLVLMVSVGLVVAGSNQAKGNLLGLPKNAVEVSPGVFYLGDAVSDGKNVRGYAFVHYAKDSDVSGSKIVVDDSWDKYKLLISEMELKWNRVATYEVYAYENNFVGAGNVMNILSASLNEWDRQTSDEIFGEPVQSNLTRVPGEKDGHNIVIWENLGSDGTIAYNALWFETETMSIVESDVVFNSYYAWADCEDGGVDCSSTMDLQNIATHEFGHNGLGDLYMPKSAELTMHGYSWYGDIDKRSLGVGDVSGIQALYGAA